MVETDPEQLEIISRTVHEALSAWRVANGQRRYKPWSKLRMKDRQSTYDSVRFILENPTADPKQQHDQWMAQKQAKGWIYGKARSDRLKTHPMLQPYGQLPEFERRKDALLNAIVRALMMPLEIAP